MNPLEPVEISVECVALFARVGHLAGEHVESMKNGNVGDASRSGESAG